MRNHSNENEFDLHENGLAGKTHFHMNGFARRLVLIQRQKVTRKWPIRVCFGFTLLHLVIVLKNSCYFLNQSEVIPKPIETRSVSPCIVPSMRYTYVTLLPVTIA